MDKTYARHRNATASIRKKEGKRYTPNVTRTLLPNIVRHYRFSLPPLILITYILPLRSIDRNVRAARLLRKAGTIAVGNREIQRR